MSQLVLIIYLLLSLFVIPQEEQNKLCHIQSDTIMRSMLVLGSLCHVFNIISSIETVKRSSDSHHHQQLSHGQELHLNNIEHVLHHIFNPSDSSHLEEDHGHDITTTTTYKGNIRTQLHHGQTNRMIHPKFRPLVRTGKPHSTCLKTTATTPHDNLHDSKTVYNTTQSSSLLQRLTGEPTEKIAHTRRRLSFADYYHQQQLRAFFAHRHEKFPVQTRSYVKTGLRR
ncbi:unnamed protein product [Adineta ricciae]|uniref:Uncharacterized protein n=1 Tax=Adineta ricciae TaxID=249248 RepID=A0A814G4D0_ADIRI|nr:unnamed protein product [Adineta ricciae]CAF0988978.1 unnamed protein product [Adineta ricciae]